MKTGAGEFVDISVRVEDIYLDVLNPRIDVPRSAEQADIRLALLATEEVIDLARGIVDNGGMLPGERIIVHKEKGRLVVLEGNRRICACQLLLDRALIPTGQKARFPFLPPEVRGRIEVLQADESPSREAAEYAITKRHTDLGVKRWSVVAKQRRIARFIAEGHTLEDASMYYNEPLSPLRRTMEGHALLTASLLEPRRAT